MGYVFIFFWFIGENIVYRGIIGMLDLISFVGNNYKNLFVSLGYWKNLMNGNFEEVGIFLL